jgi:hypothetical protein
LLFVERLGDNAAGSGLTHRVEHLRPRFAGNQDEGNRLQILIGTHCGDQLGAGHIRQVKTADHQQTIPTGFHHIQRGLPVFQRMHLAHALMLQHARDQIGLHAGRFDQDNRKVSQGGSEGHAVTPKRGMTAL